jgi:CheY-like chemotaxis protein
MLLLDLKLPKVDGLEVLRRAKADPRTRAIPIVVFSSSYGGPRPSSRRASWGRTATW